MVLCLYTTFDRLYIATTYSTTSLRCTMLSLGLRAILRPRTVYCWHLSASPTVSVLFRSPPGYLQCYWRDDHGCVSRRKGFVGSMDAHKAFPVHTVSVHPDCCCTLWRFIGGVCVRVSFSLVVVGWILSSLQVQRPLFFILLGSNTLCIVAFGRLFYPPVVQFYSLDFLEFIDGDWWPLMRCIFVGFFGYPYLLLRLLSLLAPCGDGCLVLAGACLRAQRRRPLNPILCGCYMYCDPAFGAFVDCSWQDYAIDAHGATVYVFRHKPGVLCICICSPI